MTLSTTTVDRMILEAALESFVDHGIEITASPEPLGDQVGRQIGPGLAVEYAEIQDLILDFGRRLLADAAEHVYPQVRDARDALDAATSLLAGIQPRPSL